MTLKTLVTMNAQGRITVPADARELLRVGADSQFELEVTEHEMILRPATVVRRDDAWAYAPAHLASISRALEQVASGQVRPATATDLGADAAEDMETEATNKPAEGAEGAADASRGKGSRGEAAR
jgi:AbrB family looped-hinge helix DNA binding protein